MKYLKTFGISATLALLLAGCSQAPSDTGSEVSVSNPHAGIFMTEKPSGVVSVVTARTESKPGDEVAIEGRIAGTMHPFAEGYALFMLADDAVVTCDRMPDDHCDTPWDACCVPEEELKPMRLTVQFVDENGRPVSGGLKGVNGLKELDGVIVVGTVDASSTTDNLILNATSLYKKES